MRACVASALKRSSLAPKGICGPRVARRGRCTILRHWAFALGEGEHSAVARFAAPPPPNDWYSTALPPRQQSLTRQPATDAEDLSSLVRCQTWLAMAVSS